MTKTEYRQYIASEQWQQRRKQFLAKFGECNRCEMPRWLASIIYDQDLHVHHRSYANQGCEEDYDLEALCRRCHELETFGRSDLREPVSHQCPWCQHRTWDKYRDECEGCHRDLYGYTPDLILEQPVPKAPDVQMWEMRVTQVGLLVGIDKLFDYLALAEDHLRNFYERHPFIPKPNKEETAA